MFAPIATGQIPIVVMAGIGLSMTDRIGETVTAIETGVGITGTRINGDSGMTADTMVTIPAAITAITRAGITVTTPAGTTEMGSASGLAVTDWADWEFQV